MLYLKAGLAAAHYAALLTQLGGEPVTHLRKGEDAFKALPAGATLEQIAQAIEADHSTRAACFGVTQRRLGLPPTGTGSGPHLGENNRF